ncbi:hypothetical protein [Streptomyces sp. NPDC014995]|uniref:hypothetical protein n=1 Tax=Streptomyces sp. NPDC014995 TaxID=3364936 RepID=UPI0036F69268
MTSDDVVRLFADETPVRAFAAVTLGARSTAEVVERTGLTAKDAAGALRRLEDRAVVASDDGGLTVSYDRCRGLARAAAGPGSTCTISTAGAVCTGARPRTPRCSTDPGGRRTGRTACAGTA